MIRTTSFTPEVTKDRRMRESASGVPASERYAGALVAYDWQRFVGDEFAPVVAVSIQPKVGETGGSAFLRGLQVGLTGYTTAQARLKFRGDVRGARFYRNGMEVQPYRGGHAPIAVKVDERWVQLKDVADVGYDVLPIDLFRPDSDGTAPMVTVAVQDLKNPGELSVVDYWGDPSARVWNDFLPYSRLVDRAKKQVLSNGKRNFRVQLTCSANTGTCTIDPP